MRERVAIGFDFTPDWLRKWREIFKPLSVVMQSQSKCHFDTQVKTVLNNKTHIFILDAKRKLGFLGKAGYDIFGKNKLFAPRIKWEALEGTVENIKTAAESYENAVNDIMSTVQDKQNFQQVCNIKSSLYS